VRLKRSLREISDEELVRRCQQNDHAAFTEIVDRYKDSVYWLIRRMIGNLEVEDLTQDVFLRAYRAIPRLRSRATFRTWLYRIAHNLCVTELRRRDKRGEHLSLDEEGEEKVHWLMPEGRKDQEGEINRWDLAQSVQTLVGMLPERYRTALTLFYIQQVRYEEIAEIMGIPLGTVKTYIHRGRLHLRKLILAERDLVDSIGESAEDRSGNGKWSG
jgi:RNA polymerase sigma-70 factor (ECF subfamily)